MSENEPDISDLLNELNALKDSEIDIEYSFYARKIISNHGIILELVNALSGNLKEKYRYPFSLSREAHAYVIDDDGFIYGSVVMRISYRNESNVLVVFENDRNVSDSKKKRAALIDSLKKWSTDIGRLCSSFKTKLNREIRDEKERIQKKLEAF